MDKCLTLAISLRLFSQTADADSEQNNFGENGDNFVEQDCLHDTFGKREKRRRLRAPCVCAGWTAALYWWLACPPCTVSHCALCFSPVCTVHHRAAAAPPVHTSNRSRPVFHRFLQDDLPARWLEKAINRLIRRGFIQQRFCSHD